MIPVRPTAFLLVTALHPLRAWYIFVANALPLLLVISSAPVGVVFVAVRLFSLLGPVGTILVQFDFFF